jgi:hypothetical protein
MNNIETKIREIANKWRHANPEVYDVCRDAAEELRVLRLQLQAANRELDLYRYIDRPQFYPNIPEKEYKVTCATNILGWGKGKDE